MRSVWFLTSWSDKGGARVTMNFAGAGYTVARYMPHECWGFGEVTVVVGAAPAKTDDFALDVLAVIRHLWVGNIDCLPPGLIGFDARWIAVPGLADVVLGQLYDSYPDAAADCVIAVPALPSHAGVHAKLIEAQTNSPEQLRDALNDAAHQWPKLAFVDDEADKVDVWWRCMLANATTLRLAGLRYVALWGQDGSGFAPKPYSVSFGKLLNEDDLIIVDSKLGNDNLAEQRSGEFCDVAAAKLENGCGAFLPCSSAGAAPVLGHAALGSDAYIDKNPKLLKPTNTATLDAELKLILKELLDKRDQRRAATASAKGTAAAAAAIQTAAATSVAAVASRFRPAGVAIDRLSALRSAPIDWAAPLCAALETPSFLTVGQAGAACGWARRAAFVGVPGFDEHIGRLCTPEWWDDGASASARPACLTALFNNIESVGAMPGVLTHVCGRLGADPLNAVFSHARAVVPAAFAPGGTVAVPFGARHSWLATAANCNRLPRPITLGRDKESILSLFSGISALYSAPAVAPAVSLRCHIIAVYFFGHLGRMALSHPPDFREYLTAGTRAFHAAQMLWETMIATACAATSPWAGTSWTDVGNYLAGGKWTRPGPTPIDLLRFWMIAHVLQ